LAVSRGLGKIVLVTRLKNHAGLVVVLSGAAVLLSLLPLGTAFEFTRDEGYEVMKGFLCSKGFRLYQDIWNDQPPVHTMLLAGAFKVCGPSILTARLVAAGFGLMLFAVFHQLVRRRCSAWCALAGAFLLAAAPCVVQLCGSVMLEAPAIGMALVSAWLAQQWSRRRHWGWLLASGAAMGVALQVKFTAAVVAPAVLAEVALAGRPERGWKRARRTALDALRWGGGVTVLLATIGLTWARGSLLSSWRSHFDESPVPGLGSPADYPFNTSLLTMHLDCLLAAAAGLAWAVATKRWREVAFPGILLLTASLIHCVHRPWWNYYYLHLAVPVAWLAGWALAEGVKTAYQTFAARRFALASVPALKAIAVCGLAAVVLSRSEARLEANVKEMRRSPRMDTNTLLAQMRRYAPGTHWVYAEPVIYAFHARLPAPPELAVVVAKRFWSGQISSEAILATCKRYRPEQLLLSNRLVSGDWKKFLDAGYTLACADQTSLLYVAKALIPPGAPP
jgi:hypothetical protein